MAALLTSLVVSFAAASPARAAWPFESGDRVLVLGDELTDPVGSPKVQGWVNFLETYHLMRFPGARVEFATRTDASILQVRDWLAPGTNGTTPLDQALADESPSDVIVLLGMMDMLTTNMRAFTGWPTEQVTIDRRRERLLDGLAAMLDRIVASGRRAYVASYPVVSRLPSNWAGTPAVTGFWVQLGSEVAAVAGARGATFLDVAQVTDAIAADAAARVWPERRYCHYDPPAQLAASDPADASRQVLNHVGALALAYAVITELGAPEGVSHLTVDAALGTATGTGAGATSIVVDRDAAGVRSVRFLRLDAASPIVTPEFLDTEEAIGATGVVPFNQRLNRYVLRVRGLAPAAAYRVTVAGNTLFDNTHAQYTGAELDAGVDFALSRGDNGCWGSTIVTPWDQRFLALLQVTRLRRLGVETPIAELRAFAPQLLAPPAGTPAPLPDPGSGEDGGSVSLQTPLLTVLDSVRTRYTDLQQQLAIPRSYPFVVQRID